MTTTACDDQFTVGTQTIERVRQPYDTASILRRNVADLELALRTQTERAEAAEAELAQARQQKPVAYVKYKATGGNVGLSWLAVPTGEFYPREGETLFAAPVHAPAVPELDPMTRLIVSDPKQPKPKKQEPAVPTNTIPEGDDFNGTTPHMIRCIESLVAMNDRGALAPHGLCGHSRTLLLASANRLRQQQAHVVPAVPGEWRDVMQDAHDTFQRYADQHRAKDTRDSHEKANINQKLANRLYALLQSAEGSNAAADRLLEGGK